MSASNSNDQMPGKLITITVAYALPEQQILLNLETTEGTSLLEALKQSGIEAQLPGIALEEVPVGIFGTLLTDKEKTKPVKAGDRIEIYRPLIKENRRLK